MIELRDQVFRLQEFDFLLWVQGLICLQVIIYLEGLLFLDDIDLILEEVPNGEGSLGHSVADPQEDLDGAIQDLADGGFVHLLPLLFLDLLRQKQAQSRFQTGRLAIGIIVRHFRAFSSRSIIVPRLGT